MRTKKHYKFNRNKPKDMNKQNKPKVMDKQSLCESSGCKLYSTFGFPGKVPKYCNLHRHAGMVNFELCKHVSCVNSAAFGYYGHKPEYCKFHESAGMIEL